MLYNLLIFKKLYIMKSISVFCGSSLGEDIAFEKMAFELGHALADKNISLIYGGAKVGLMGAVADATLKKDGHVIGVLPRFLKEMEVAHDDLSELILVDSMHERKTKMSELCEGVIALPGGFGTIEELFEMLTWGQLGLHKKPVAILNINGFYDSLVNLIDEMQGSGFLKKSSKDILIVSDNIQDLLEKMHQYIPPTEGKWIQK